MLSAFALACALHPFYCHSAAAAPFLAAVDAEVTDERLRSVLVVMAAHESGLQPDPAPQSWDSRAHVSCSYLQQRCDRIRGRAVQRPATHFVRQKLDLWRPSILLDGH